MGDEQRRDVGYEISTSSRGFGLYDGVNKDHRRMLLTDEYGVWTRQETFWLDRGEYAGWRVTYSKSQACMLLPASIEPIDPASARRELVRVRGRQRRPERAGERRKGRAPKVGYLESIARGRIKPLATIIPCDPIALEDGYYWIGDPDEDGKFRYGENLLGPSQRGVFSFGGNGLYRLKVFENQVIVSTTDIEQRVMVPGWELADEETSEIDEESWAERRDRILASNESVAAFFAEESAADRLSPDFWALWRGDKEWVKSLGWRVVKKKGDYILHHTDDLE